MRGVQGVEVAVHGLGHLVDQLVGHLGLRDQEVGNGHRGHRLGLAGVGVRRNLGGHVGRAADLGHHLLGHGHHADLDRAGQIADRGHAQAGRLQGGVELAVLDQLDRFAEGQVLDLGQVLVCQARRLEDGARVQLGAGLGRAHRHALALQVGQGLDARVLAGDDLDVVVVGGRKAAQVLQRLLEARLGVAGPGVGHRVAQRERQLATTRLQQVEVFGRGLGDLRGGARVGDGLGEDLRQRHAQRVVHAALPARQHVDELGLLRQHGAAEGQQAGGQARRDLDLQTHVQSSSHEMGVTRCYGTTTTAQWGLLPKVLPGPSYE